MRRLEQLGFCPISPRGAVPHSNQGEIMSSEVSSRRLFAATMLLALAFTSLTQTGCTRPIRRLGIIDELAITYRDRVWAQRAFNLRFANCNREFADHFRNGFCAGYSDVCGGGDGFAPALPPDQYRGYEFQCAEGSKCIESWFDGYPAGVAAAREEKAGSFHEVHISRMIDQAVTQSKAPNPLPSDVPVTKPSPTLLPPAQRAAKKLAQSSVVSGQHAAARTPLDSVKAKATTAAAKANVNNAPVSHSILAPLNPQVKVSAKLPPIIKAPQRAKPVQPAPVARTVLPPIVQAKPITSSAPPIIRGRKIDPSAVVSKNEIPLPMAVRSSFDTRTAAWPVNRK